jgi:transcriptional regulator with XRE-family HTH domain
MASDNEPTLDPRETHRQSAGNALWRHIGRRMQLRRTQLDLSVELVAQRLSVSAQLYAQYEAGELQTPAMRLSDLAQLFHLPVTWFFQDLSFDNAEGGGEEEEPGVLVVATDEERVQTLADYFGHLNLEGQQHLLLVARTLYQSQRGTKPD